MSSGEPQNSQGQFHRSQIALTSSPTSVPTSQPTDLEYCYPSAIIEALQAGSGTHRDVSSTIQRSTLEFGPVTRQGDFIGQAQLSQNTGYSGENVSSALSPDPGPSLLPSTVSTQHRGDLPSSNFSDTREQLTVGDPRMRDYSMSSYPLAMGQEAYLPGQMAQNTNIWPSRAPRPLQASTPLDQQSQLFSSPGYMGYNPQRSNSEQAYYQSQRPPAQYLSSHQGQPQLRSHSMSYPYPSASIAGSPPLSDQSMIANSPNYILNQPEYYFPDTPSMPSNPCSMSVSPQPQPSTIYSSPESARNSSDADQVRGLNSRPRPQCWDHGCNGREFSTFSNLLRHQREKSGAVAKAECPICGAVFTRSTARNIHVSQGKCKSGGGSADAGRY